MRAAQRFVDRLAKLELPNVFNPYSESCSIHDIKSSPAQRKKNLVILLHTCAAQQQRSVWMGRDLGYRGGRRTGVALTDEVHLPVLAVRCQAPTRILKATQGEAYAERTATVIWSVLRNLQSLPFLWNAFPLHPYENGNAMSNRAHTASELRAVLDLHKQLFDYLQPNLIVAIGNDAHKAMTSLGFETHRLRHPSYGGQTEFLEGAAKLCGAARSHRG